MSGELVNDGVIQKNLNTHPKKKEEKSKPEQKANEEKGKKIFSVVAPQND